MNFKGYEIGMEPTDAEHEVYMRVKAFYDRMDIAGALHGFKLQGGEKLTQEEFELLCHRFGKLDFGDAVWDAVGWEYDDIIAERSEI